MTTQNHYLEEIPNLSTLEPLDGTHFQWCVCQHPGCGEVIKASVRNGQALCDTHKQATKHGVKLPQKRPEFEGEVTIVYDPLPVDDGGFTPGARFSILDFCAMVRNLSLTPGSKAKVTYRGTYTVTPDGYLVDGRGAVWYCTADQIAPKKAKGSE